MARRSEEEAQPVEDAECFSVGQGRAVSLGQNEGEGKREGEPGRGLSLIHI